MLELDAGCQLRYDLKEGMTFLQRLSLADITQFSGSPQTIFQDKSLLKNCSEVLRTIREYLKLCYTEVKSSAIAKMCIGVEAAIFKEKLQKSEIDLADLFLALIGRKASVLCLFHNVKVTSRDRPIGCSFCFLQIIWVEKAPERISAISAETRKNRRGQFLPKVASSAEICI